MSHPGRPGRRQRRGAGPFPRSAPQRSWLARSWPGLAVVGLLLVTSSILLVNQRHSGDPLKVRRELRKF